MAAPNAVVALNYKVNESKISSLLGLLVFGASGRSVRPPDLGLWGYNCNYNTLIARLDYNVSV